jgi:hypothetical protein
MFFQNEKKLFQHIKTKYVAHFSKAACCQKLRREMSSCYFIYFLPVMGSTDLPSVACESVKISGASLQPTGE